MEIKNRINYKFALSAHFDKLTTLIIFEFWLWQKKGDKLINVIFSTVANEVHYSTSLYTEMPVAAFAVN